MIERKVYNKKEVRTRKLMIEKGVTIKMLADHMDVSTTAIHARLNRGTVEPLVKAINEIDALLKKKEKEIYSDTGTEG